MTFWNDGRCEYMAKYIILQCVGGVFSLQANAPRLKSASTSSLSNIDRPPCAAYSALNRTLPTSSHLRLHASTPRGPGPREPTPAASREFATAPLAVSVVSEPRQTLPYPRNLNPSNGGKETVTTRISESIGLEK